MGFPKKILVSSPALVRIGSDVSYRHLAETSFGHTFCSMAPSTPPRHRIRAKSLTSASSSSRPSALKGSELFEAQRSERGRSKTKQDMKRKNGELGPLAEEVAAAANEKHGKKVKKEIDPKKSEKEQETKKDKEKAKNREKKQENPKDPKKSEKEEDKKKKKKKKKKDPKKSEKEEENEKDKEEDKNREKKQENPKDPKKSEKEQENEKDKKNGKKREKERENPKEEENKNKKKEDPRKLEKEQEIKKDKKSEKKVDVEDDTAASGKRKRSSSSGKEKKKKDTPVVFEPAQKREIQHIFKTPPKKLRVASPPASEISTSMSSKEKADLKFQALAEHLQLSDSDDDDDDSAEAGTPSDLEQIIETMASKDSENELSEEEEEMEEQEEESSTDDAEEAKEEAKEAEKESEESSEEEPSESPEEDEEASPGSEDDEEEENDDEEEEKDEEEKKEGEGEKTSHALVPVTEDTKCTALAIKNSVTHKKEWDSFCRTAKSKMPVQLNEMFATQKQELFNVWMDCNKEWSKCTFEVERRHQVSNTASRGWTSIQGKELKQKYSEEKWEQIKKKRKEQGLFYPDDDFPNDDDETWTNLWILSPFPVFPSHTKTSLLKPSWIGGSVLYILAGYLEPSCNMFILSRDSKFPITPSAIRFLHLAKEAWYFVKQAQNFTRQESTSEGTTLKGKMNLDNDMLAAITDQEDGLMRPGAMPQLEVASAAGNKTLLDAIVKAGFIRVACSLKASVTVRHLKIPTKPSLSGEDSIQNPSQHLVTKGKMIELKIPARILGLFGFLLHPSR